MDSITDLSLPEDIPEVTQITFLDASSKEILSFLEIKSTSSFQTKTQFTILSVIRMVIGFSYPA
jgi:hypothetical protein